MMQGHGSNPKWNQKFTKNEFCSLTTSAVAMGLPSRTENVMAGMETHMVLTYTWEEDDASPSADYVCDSLLEYCLLYPHDAFSGNEEYWGQNFGISIRSTKNSLRLKKSQPLGAFILSRSIIEEKRARTKAFMVY
ncbi:hypothetical protein L1887_13793 [Cichorium endivia]|nr:hypothetical protein L1887_13793 [Cichorium endivia]